MAFMDDLRSRLANRVQLTSDGHKAYLEAVEGAFGGDVDYAQLMKTVRRRSGEREGPLQPGRMYRRAQSADRGQPGPEAHQHVVCRAPELEPADAYAPLHAAHQCLLKEGREPRMVCGAVHDLLQLCPHPQDAPHVTGDGGRRDRSALGNWRYRCACRGDCDGSPAKRGPYKKDAA